MTDIFLDIVSLLALIFVLQGKNEKTWNFSSYAGSQHFLIPLHSHLDDIK